MHHTTHNNTQNIGLDSINLQHLQKMVNNHKISVYSHATKCFPLILSKNRAATNATTVPKCTKFVELPEDGPIGPRAGDGNSPPVLEFKLHSEFKANILEVR